MKQNEVLIFMCKNICWEKRGKENDTLLDTDLAGLWSNNSHYDHFISRYTSKITMDTEETIQNGETITESCYNDDDNDPSEAAPTIDNSISPTERHKTWQKRKRQGTTKRAKERRVAEWSVLSEEQQEERKQLRKQQQLEQDQKLLNALENGLNVCIDLGFDGVNVSDKVTNMLFFYHHFALSSSLCLQSFSHSTNH